MVDNQERLLPMVTPETGESIQADFSLDRSYHAKIMDRLSRENPCILEFITRIGKLSQKMGYNGTLAMDAGLMVYRLLESQAESDRMKKELR